MSLLVFFSGEIDVEASKILEGFTYYNPQTLNVI